MAWKLCTKNDVLSIHPAAESTLQDFWSDAVEALIREYLGTPYLGLQETVTEYYDGTGTNILLVKSPPIVSVTSVRVAGADLQPSDYIVTDTSIQLLNQIFPAGQLNVVVTYTSGTPVSGVDGIDPIVRMTAAAMIVAILQYRGRAGADASIKWAAADVKDGEATPTKNVGLTSHLQAIMKRMLRKTKVRIH